MRAKHSNGFTESAPAWSLCLKTWLRLPVLVYFRKQQRNISNILIVSTSASANSHRSESYLCFKGEHSRRNIQHFHTQRVNQQSPNLFLQGLCTARSAVMWKDFTLCILNTNSPYCILGCVGSLSALLLDGKANLFFYYVRSFTSVLNFLLAVLHLRLCYREQIKLI